MKLTLTLFVLLAFGSFGQLIAPAESWNNIDSTLCLYQNDSVFVQSDYHSYYTTDSTWNGPIDSSYCFNNSGVGAWGVMAYAAELDSGKPLFIEASTTTTPLLENTVYHFNLQGVAPNLLDLDCSDGNCTKANILVRKPNEAGTGDTVELYQSAFHLDPISGELTTCFATEKFQGSQYLDRFVLEFNFNPTPTPQDLSFQVYSLESFTTQLMSNSTISGNTFGNQVGFSSLQNVLFWHDQPGYPSATNIHYVDLAPSPNVSTPTNVTVNVPVDSYLFFQPFVELRGGEVDGGGDYHTYSIVNNGSDICITGMFEIKFLNGNEYVHNDGSIYMGERACMLFDNEGKLTVAEDKTLDYGTPGTGMLGLFSDGEIHVRKNATLNVFNMLVLGEDQNELSEGAHAYLSPGASLNFKPGSGLMDKSENESLTLFVHMNRSSVDLSGLSEAEREKIVLLYDNENTEALGLEILPNPVVSSVLNFRIDAQEVGELSTIIYGVNGQKIDENTIHLDGTSADHELSVSTLKSGVYLLSLEINGMAEVQRFEVIHE